MTTIDKLIELDRTTPRRILVIGDPMTDIYVVGKLVDTCQEGCPKFVQSNVVSVPGGASNAARCLNKWFTQTRHLFNNLTCPTKTRFIVDDKCIFRYDNDVCDVVGTKFACDRSINLIKEDWAEGVLISDYDKGFLSEELIREVIDLCNKKNIPCVSDVKRHPDIYKGSILKCNAEYEKKWNYQGNVCTCGPIRPFVETELVGSSLLSFPVKCINHVGAGDCFAAHLILALTHGFSLKESAEIAHSAGRVYVQKLFNTPPTPEEIKLDMTP